DPRGRQESRHHGARGGAIANRCGREARADGAETSGRRSRERTVRGDPPEAAGGVSPRARTTHESGGEGGSVLTAAAIAQLTGGTVQGDAQASVDSVASLDRARAGQLSFCASAKYAPLLADTNATIVLVSPDVAESDTR